MYIKKNTYMVWLSQNSNLNPINHSQKELDRNVYDWYLSSHEDMQKALNNSWNNISHDTTDKSIAHMPRLVKKVIKCKGGYFNEKYI